MSDNPTRGPNWGAIGSIASVLSVVVAVIALWPTFAGSPSRPTPPEPTPSAPPPSGALNPNLTEGALDAIKGAEAGDPTAMNRLGGLYELGKGNLPQSRIDAFKWFKEAARLGNSEAMQNLGYYYENGFAVDQSLASAAFWYEKSGLAGNGFGWSSLGALYEFGGENWGVDHAKAVESYKKAAELNDPLGMERLGYMYERGRGGLDPDASQAAYWYKRASDEGDAHATDLLHKLQG